MNKKYISPITKVFKISPRAGVLQSTSPTEDQKNLDPTEEASQDGGVDARTTGSSTNIWDNEW